MNKIVKLPDRLYGDDHRINLNHLHETFRAIAGIVSAELRKKHAIDVAITAGMWGGSYLIAGDDGRARTNVVRLYSIVNLPQGSPLDEEKNFERLMEIYHRTFKIVFDGFGLNLTDPRWGEAIPYSNRIRPTTTLQMWDTNGLAKFVRAFFVWNTATWEESIIYDAIRNVLQLKELLNINKRPPKKTKEELKFLLQDILITYFTLQPALSTDFEEHAKPVIAELYDQFLTGLNDLTRVNEQFQNVYNNAIVYGLEEALEGPYQQDHLDIQKIEDWPVEKINWVPEGLKKKLVPHLKNTFSKFKDHLESGQ